MQQTSDKQVLLKELKQQQDSLKEGSLAWHEVQSQINHIIAENFLQYVNRL